MRGWSAPVYVLLIVACSSDRNGPGIPPEVPEFLDSTTLDEAVALHWDDNAFVSDPNNFEHYRVYSASHSGMTTCGDNWRLEGTTVAPEFLVAALTNGVSRCFAVSAVSVDGAESALSGARADTPRPDSRNVALFARQVDDAQSGFRFWHDFNGDNVVQNDELGVVRSGSVANIDFSVERDGSGTLFLTPVRAGTGVELYSDLPVEDLTSIDVAPNFDYRTSGIEASPGYGYVWEMDGASPLPQYGALRVTHVGQEFLIFDWAYQTDPGNPDLLIAGTSGK
jgi:hypothetical protein